MHGNTDGRRLKVDWGITEAVCVFQEECTAGEALLGHLHV